MIAFLLILGVSFYFIATSLGKLVGDYLFITRINKETAYVHTLVDRFSSAFYEADAETLYNKIQELPEVVEGQSVIILLDMDGKVQVDSQSINNGYRFRHGEVLNALRGNIMDANGKPRDVDYGFHRVTAVKKPPEEEESNAERPIFDFLRGLQTEKEWVGYFASPMIYNEAQIGVLLYVVKVEDLATSLRVMQDRMLLYLIVASFVVLVLSLFFSSIITKPMAALTVGINKMAGGDFSSRVKENGRDEMARLAVTFNQMSEKLENLDNSRNEFVSNASHELKTPLATMKIMLESLMYQDDIDPKIQKEFMADINTELDRLGHIVTDLLTLVQSDSNDYQLRRMSVSLREVVEETLRRIMPFANVKEQQIIFKPQSDCAVLGDMTKLQQAVYNLIDNAIKYSPNGGVVLVTLKQEGRTAVLEVKDSGPGIPKKDQAHIFDRFYRVDRARARATGGNGLGLSIVQQTVKLHDGKVIVMSEEGKGSTFRVELPV